MSSSVRTDGWGLVSATASSVSAPPRQRTQEIARLKSTIARLGGYRRVRSCGEPVTDVEYASVLAWFTKLNVGFVGYLPNAERTQPYPIVLFTPVSDGWTVEPWHTLLSKRAGCEGLSGAHVQTPQARGGVAAYAEIALARFKSST